jgi:hypothetical protein
MSEGCPGLVLRATRGDYNNIPYSIREDNLFNLIRAGVLLIKFLSRLFYI